MRVARWTLAVVLAIGAGRATAAPDDAKPRFLASPRAYVELPPSPTPEDVVEGERLLLAVEGVARVLDAQLVVAGVLDKSKVPPLDITFKKPHDIVSPVKSPPAGSWRCVLMRTRDDLVALGKPLQFVINTQGTAFYCNGRDAVLGYVPITDDGQFRREVLDWGTQLVLYHRIGLQFRRAEDPPGMCLFQGLKSFMRWSHLPSAGGMPAELGGIPDSTLTKLEAVAKDDGLLSLERLFAAKSADFDDKQVQETLYGESALLVEMLWHREPTTRKPLLALFAKYAASSRPVKEFSYAAFLDQFRKSIGDAAAIEKELRAWILEKSRALNAKKQEAAAK